MAPVALQTHEALSGLFIIKREAKVHSFHKRDGAAIGGSIVGIIFWIILIWALVVCIRRRRRVVVIQETSTTATQQQTNVDVPVNNTNANNTTGANINFYMAPVGQPMQPGMPMGYAQPMPIPMAPVHTGGQETIAMQQATMTAGPHTIQKTNVEVTTAEVGREMTPPVEAPPSYQGR